MVVTPGSIDLIPVILERRARTEADDPAFTFVDYDVDPDGYAETLTWSELYARVRVVAAELLRLGVAGDRVAILAPQSMDYIVGFLGALEAGLVAVPLSVPLFGAHDERASRVLESCEPVAVLTTTSVIDAVLPSVNAAVGQRISVIELDALDYDGPAPSFRTEHRGDRPALLQYTSGSTGTPSGVIVSHRNIAANIEQIRGDHYTDVGGAPSPDTTYVSWLPLFHDMGLMVGILAPLGLGLRGVVTSPMSFLQKPARWMQLLASHPSAQSAAPNFAFDLAVRRTRDEDLEGLSLAGVHGIINGAERVQSTTARRFNERFSAFGLREGVQMPGYGLAEATLYVSSIVPGDELSVAAFDLEKLAAGYALRVEASADDRVSEQVGLGRPRNTTYRIVDPETGTECRDGQVGEIWVYGESVAQGYWNDPVRTAEVFHARLTSPPEGTPEGPWMRTGDLGVLFEGELFLVGRIKDLIVIDGRNHYPDDIEATVTVHTGARTAALAVPGDGTDQLVVVAELRRPPADPDELATLLRKMRGDVAAAISHKHALRVAEVALVPQGAIPITTSGKPRRRETANLYRSGALERFGGAE